MGFIKEFKEFAMRGNVIDMAVGIIIGAAFGKIVSSMVSDIMMPPLGKAMGGVDFKDKFVNLSSEMGPFQSLAEAKAAGAPTINYGVFINEVINFVIVAFAIFLVIKAINTAKKRFEKEKESAAPPEPSLQEKLLMEIRDSLKARA